MRSGSIQKFSAKAARVHFRRNLLKWYTANKRDLPWRQNTDPYRVWLSEMMLQQTRVAAVVDYYQRFLKRFPTIEKLAKAREASVLAAWSGLGYYRRARMLHAAAKEMVGKHGSQFPRTASELQNLPGIGRYTAAAIASIAFREPVAVVDGNVERVLGRISGKHLETEYVWKMAGQLLDAQQPGDFNQAMMELGAMVCLPREPLCPVCPVRSFCRTRGALAPAEKNLRQKKCTIHYALDCRKESVFLVRRSQTASLMAGMWELPELVETNGCAVQFLVRHSITITDYTVRVTGGPAPKETEGTWVPKSKVGTLPLTGLARKILRAAEII
jgi:A/G-specific adenine glycosylase